MNSFESRRLSLAATSPVETCRARDCCLNHEKRTFFSRNVGNIFLKTNYREK